MVEQHLARFRQVNALADTVEKRRIRDFFQLFDLQGNGSMCQMQFLGGAGERKMRRRRREYLKLADGNILHQQAIAK